MNGDGCSIVEVVKWTGRPILVLCTFIFFSEGFISTNPILVFPFMHIFFIEFEIRKYYTNENEFQSYPPLDVTYSLFLTRRMAVG